MRDSSRPLRHCRVRLLKPHSAQGGGSGALATLRVFATWTNPPPPPRPVCQQPLLPECPRPATEL